MNIQTKAIYDFVLFYLNLDFDFDFDFDCMHLFLSVYLGFSLRFLYALEKDLRL